MLVSRDIDKVFGEQKGLSYMHVRCKTLSFNSTHRLYYLRGPAPKKRPMISGQQIKSADFYLPSRGYRIVFKNEFLLFQFSFKPKISSRKLFPSDSCKIRPKIRPRKILLRNYYRNAK